MDLFKDYSTPEIIVTIVVSVAIPALIFIFKYVKLVIERKKLYNWVKRNTTKREFRSIRTIASKNNITIEHAEKVLSSHKKLRRGLGTEKDIWTLNED